MKDVSVINLIALGYAVVLALVTLIFFRTYVIWAVLGSATALFNHTQAIGLTRQKFDAKKYISQLALRFVMYIIVIGFAYFDQKANGTDELIRVYIFLLLGFVSIKVGIFMYMTPFFKKHRLKNDEIVEEGDEHVESNN